MSRTWPTDDNSGVLQNAQDSKENAKADETLWWISNFFNAQLNFMNSNFFKEI